MSKEHIIYDNTDLYGQRDEIRLELFDEWASDQDWITPIDVPDSMIDDEIEFRDKNEWENAQYRLDKLISSGHFLLTGYCGRWNGRCDGGKFINDVDELLTCLQHLDGITISDVDGHLMIDGYHHDGHDHYELKKLTKKGYEYANNNYFANSRELHNKIFNCNLFSCLPRLTNI